MSAPDHLLHMTVTSEGHMAWRLECLRDDGAFQHKSWNEPRTAWPDANTCRCEDSECPCRESDHGGCSEFGMYIEEVGYECRCVESNECWTQSYLDEVGGECIWGDDWPEDVAPLPCRADWEGGLALRYCPPETS